MEWIRRICFFIPALVLLLAFHTEEFFKKTKRSWMYMRETEWIRRICFFIPALVFLLALLILKNFLRKLKGHGRT